MFKAFGNFKIRVRLRALVTIGILFNLIMLNKRGAHTVILLDTYMALLFFSFIKKLGFFSQSQTNFFFVRLNSSTAPLENILNADTDYFIMSRYIYFDVYSEVSIRPIRNKLIVC